MPSKEIVNILGLELHVFGLEEYKQLPNGTPLCAMFYVTAVQTTQKYVEKYCREMCSMNNNRKPNDRYLITISLDHPNAGTRTLYRDDPYHHLKDTTMVLMNQMYTYGKTTAYNISSIIECFDIHVFGEDSNIHIEKWGVSGFSMGGFTAALAASKYPKVETIVMMAASLSYKLWMKHVSEVLSLELDYQSRKRTIKMLDEGLKNIYNELSNTKVLILHGDQDERSCLPDEAKSIEELRLAHKGVEGVDWKHMILPVKGHRICDAYNTEAMKWVYKWMISSTPFEESKI